MGTVIVRTGFGELTHLRAMQAAGIEVLGLVGCDGAKAQAQSSSGAVERAPGRRVPAGARRDGRVEGRRVTTPLAERPDA